MNHDDNSRRPPALIFGDLISRIRREFIFPIPGEKITPAMIKKGRCDLP